MINLVMFKVSKKLSSGFQSNAKFVSVNQIIYKISNKSTRTHGHQTRFSRNGPKHSNDSLHTILNGIKLLPGETDFQKLLVSVL